jgi:flagellar biosynthesis protein
LRTKGASPQAVALRYAPQEDGTPQVTAKGGGDVAERILQPAREHKIPIRQDKDLIQVLPRLDLDQEVPTHASQAVAEILAYICRASQKRQGA